MLSKHILATIAYYDVMDYPMTGFEIWKYLTKVNSKEGDEDKKYSIGEVLQELEKEKLLHFIEEYRGFYFLQERKELVGQRLERNKLSQQKMKIARRVTKWLRFVPYVRMVAVTGSLAMKNSSSGSDIDFLVVLEKGKIFTGRALVTLFIHLLGKRRYGKKICNRICLNYFITTASLEINLKDIFSASEYSFIFPLFGFKTFQEFKMINTWIEKYKINYPFEEEANLRVVSGNKFSLLVQQSGEKILNFDFLEEQLRRWQTRRIMADPRTQRTGSIIIANEEMLVFLPEPQGPKLYTAFQEKLVGMIQDKARMA